MTVRILATSIMFAAAMLICLILPFVNPALTPVQLLQENWPHYVVVVILLTTAVVIIEAKP